MQLLSYFQRKKVTGEIISGSLSEVLYNVNKYGYTLIELLDAETDALFAKDSNSIRIETEKIQPIDGFISVGRINNADLRNKSRELNIHYLYNPVNTFFENKYDIITGMHLFKKLGKKGILNPHQDSSLTDEKIYTSFFLWYPINGSNEKDGTIEVIPYSHKLSIFQRSLNISWPLLRYEKDLWKLMKKINVRSGQAVIIHSRTIHASGINYNRNIRMASNLFLKPKEAPFLHYYANQPDAEKIEVYQVDESFYSNDNIMEKPNGYQLYRTEKNENAVYANFGMVKQALKQFSESEI